jgi:hypothetical protein
MLSILNGGISLYGFIFKSAFLRSNITNHLSSNEFYSSKNLIYEINNIIYKNKEWLVGHSLLHIAI